MDLVVKRWVTENTVATNNPATWKSDATVEESSPHLSCNDRQSMTHLSKTCAEERTVLMSSCLTGMVFTSVKSCAFDRTCLSHCMSCCVGKATR